MNNKSLQQIIRKNYCFRVFFPLAVTLLLLTFLLVNPFHFNFQAKKVSALNNIESAYDGGHHYITIKSGKLYYAGSDYYVSNTLKGRVYYTISDNKCYFFILSDGSISHSFKKTASVSITARLISNNSMQQSIIASMSEELGFSSTQLQAISSPIIISEFDYSQSLTTYYMIAALILCGLSGIITLFTLLQTCFPNFSYPVLHLSRYGNHKTLFAIAETEYDTATAAGRKNIYVTDNFLIYLDRHSTGIIPLENIVWIYKFSEFRKSKGHTKVYLPLCIVTDAKKTFKIPHVSEHVADRIINNLQERYPSILVGLHADGPN